MYACKVGKQTLKTVLLSPFFTIITGLSNKDSTCQPQIAQGLMIGSSTNSCYKLFQVTLK